MPLACGIARGHRQTPRAELSTASTRLAVRRQVQREAAGRGEAVERRAARVMRLPRDSFRAGRGRCRSSGRAAGRRRAGSPFMRTGTVAGTSPAAIVRFERQVLVLAHRRRRCAARCLSGEAGPSGSRRSPPCAVHALVERLDHQVIAVAIDDQGGQQVAFAVHQAVGVGVATTFAAELERRAQAALEERRGRFLRLGWRAGAGRFARWSCSARCPAGGRAGRAPVTAAPGWALAAVGDVAREDPGMAGGDAVRGLAVDAYFAPFTASPAGARCGRRSKDASRTAS